MHFRLVSLCLFVVLPMLNGAPAGPMPKAEKPPPPKQPRVYALLYVGMEKNHKDSAKQIDKAISALQKIVQPLSEPRIKRLAVVKRQEDARAWLDAKLHVESLKDTAAVRVWLADGTPSEQAILVNAVVKVYLKDAESARGLLKRRLEELKRKSGKATGEEKKEIETEIRKVREEIDELPRLVEEAAVIKDKP